jgi:hypothetical protein
MHDFDEDNDGRFPTGARSRSVTPARSKKNRPTAAPGPSATRRGAGR